MSFQPTVLVYDPDTGEWVTLEEYQKRLERRKIAQEVRAQLLPAMVELLQGAVIQLTLTGNVCGTTVTIAGTGMLATMGTGATALLLAIRGGPGGGGGP
jgi:hypothetical protein